MHIHQKIINTSKKVLIVFQKIKRPLKVFQGPFTII